MNSDLPPANADLSPDAAVQMAEYVLLNIEAVTLYVTRRMRLVLRQMLGHMKVEIEEYDFDKMVAFFDDPTVRINIHDIESSTEYFQDHVPDLAPLHAAVAHVISKK